MVTVADVKEYLRIPCDDEDVFIQSIIEAGYDYLQDAVDDFDKLYQSNERFARKADYFVKLPVATILISIRFTSISKTLERNTISTIRPSLPTHTTWRELRRSWQISAITSLYKTNRRRR